ncbi:NAD(P)-binding protein [Chiua virens]|nr:NAD(P)-binding protein [Chiua virens]
MAKASSYATKGQKATPEEHYQRTVSRIEQVQSHLKNPRRQQLNGKVCVITGVGSLYGIGRASALLFAHEGARHLYLMDFSPENLPDLKSTIESTYPDVKVTTIQADAADDAAIAAVCKQAIDEEGQMDVFFANAGIAKAAVLHDTTSKQFMETMRINTLSCFLAVKHGSQAMMHTNPSSGKTLSGGSIILTASGPSFTCFLCLFGIHASLVAGLRSGAGAVDYRSVNSIAQTSVYQLQKTDIRVNSICPGLIETGMTKSMFDAARERGNERKIGQLNAMGRYGVPQEIAKMALFLASGEGRIRLLINDALDTDIQLEDESSYVNGQNLAVDGGLSSSHPVIPGKWA